MAFPRGAVSYVLATLCTYGSGPDRVGCDTMFLERADIEYHPLSIDKDDASVLRPQKQRQSFAEFSNNASGSPSL